MELRFAFFAVGADAYTLDYGVMGNALPAAGEFSAIVGKAVQRATA